MRKPLEIAHTSSSHHNAVDLVLDSILAHLLRGLTAHAQRVYVGISHLSGSRLHLSELLLRLSLQLLVDGNIMSVSYSLRTQNSVYWEPSNSGH